MAPVKITGAIAAALSMAIISISYLICHCKSKVKKTQKSNFTRRPKNGLVGAIGNTPLIRINRLSEATGCEILGKAEFLNPGGSVKDRALKSGELAPGGIVTEGSAGSTAISLATVAPAYGCKHHVVIPDDVAIEKVRPVSITHRDHYINIARRRAAEANELASRLRKADQTDAKVLNDTNGLISNVETNQIFLSDCKGDQFENLANFYAHYEGTGPEILEQTDGNMRAFVAAAGIGGTEQNPSIKILVDPSRSGLFNKVTRGVNNTREEAKGKRLKNPFDTITEGIGSNRLTQNFLMAKLDGAFRGIDMEAVEMSRHKPALFLLKDALFLGSSSAMNCVEALMLEPLLTIGRD
ncbi:Pyridoxal-phosphate dependent enzyme [Dillenia turbinata]|uniref:cysteine synthase n=1 Tax=Dillenia turbinata TaxID=194707 RepID=A0AAN8WC52_9MAGN